MKLILNDNILYNLLKKTTQTTNGIVKIKI